MGHHNTSIKMNLKLIAFIAFLAIGTNLFAQKELKNKNWKVGVEKDIDGTKLKRLEGENENKITTNLSFQNQTQLYDRLKKKKSDGGIGGDKYKREMKRYHDFAKGGLVQLYLERESEPGGNLKNFKIEIQNMDGEVLHSKKMKSKSPKLISGSHAWKNQGFFWINKVIPKPFIVIINETNGDILRSYKFEVN